MKRTLAKRIFARCGDGQFVGRQAEIDLLLRHASGGGDSNGLVLLAEPSAGASELLRQTYDRNFFLDNGVIPFYFEVKASDGTARGMALRFVREFLLQTVAFRARNTTILDTSPKLDEIAELAAPADGYWVERLIAIVHGESRLDDRL